MPMACRGFSGGSRHWTVAASRSAAHTLRRLQAGPVPVHTTRPKRKGGVGQGLPGCRLCAVHSWRPVCAPRVPELQPKSVLAFPVLHQF